MNRPPVLFLPGTLCTPAVFKHQADTLSVYAPRVDSLRFNQQSSIAAMAEHAIEHIDRRDGAAIIGFSMGGMVALEIIRRAPELVKKLALLNSNYQADNNERTANREMHLEQARSVGIERIIRRFFIRNYLFTSDTSNEDLIVGMAGELGISCFGAQCSALSTRADSTATLASISCPTLVLGSAQDRLCTPATQQEMHQAIKNSELLLLDDCGHFSLLERPAEVSQALSRWYLGS